MSVHYKFKSNLDHDTVTFDGLNISVADLKKSIMQQKKIGKSSDFDLQITNAQTKEVYDNDDMLVPKNTSVIVARVPVQGGTKKNWDKPDLPLPIDDDDMGHIRYDRIVKNADLVNANTSEEDKVKAMITQSSQEYDPSKYVKSRSMTGPLPPSYTCFRCGKQGHWIKNCPTNNPDVKRSTGIPRSFMVPVDGPEHKGALLTSSGDYAVPLIDHQAYKEVKKEKPPFVPQDEPVAEPEAEVPEELLCMVCKDLLQDAVLIPCCGNSFCDECVRQVLLESENHECPICHEINVSPNTLIPNRFLRTAVLNYKNETGYTKIRKAAFMKSPPTQRVDSPQPSPDSTVESQSHGTDNSATQFDRSPKNSEVKKDSADLDLAIKKEDDENFSTSGNRTPENMTPKGVIEEDSDAQPGTPLADEPPNDGIGQNLPIQTIGQEQYNTDRYDYHSSSKYSRNHRDDYRRHYEEDSHEPRPISTIETITNTRKNKFGRLGPVRQHFPDQRSHRDDRSDNYYHERDDYHSRYDKRHTTERGSRRTGHYDKSSRDSRYTSSSAADYSLPEHENNYDLPVRSEDTLHRHQDRYRSPPPPPHPVLIPPVPAMFTAPVPAIPPPHPALLPTPQVFPPQPPPPGASPINTSHITSQPPPPGVGPLLPVSTDSGTFVPRPFESEDPLKDASVPNERSIDDRMEEFQRKLEKRHRYSRDRGSRSRSRSSERHRSRSSSRSRTYSSSKSWTRSPSRSSHRSSRSRSRTPFSSRSRSRSYSHSRSRSWSKKRSYTRSRSRTRTDSRSRSRSRAESSIRRRGHDSRDRVRSPISRGRSRSYSPKGYRVSSHRNLSYSNKHSYTPPQYTSGASYQSQYGPPPTILPLPVVRPPAFPPHHLHSMPPPIQPMHSRPVEQYPVERQPKYPYGDQYPLYDMFPPKYPHQRYERDQREHRVIRYDKRSEYQRHQEEVPHRIPGHIGERSRDYKPRYRQTRDPQRKEIRELPQISESDMRVIHSKESSAESSSKKKDEKLSVKHKKHHHHHKSKEVKKLDNKIPVMVSGDKQAESSKNLISDELTAEKDKEKNNSIESDSKTTKSTEKVKDKKHKHKKHKTADQSLKKKKSAKKEKAEGPPSTDSDLPTKTKVKKKKTKLKTIEEEKDTEPASKETEQSPVSELPAKTEETVESKDTTVVVSKDTAVEDSVKPIEDPDVLDIFADDPEAADLNAELNPEDNTADLENVAIDNLELVETENIEMSGNSEEEEVEEAVEDENVLRVDMPGISKWERDESEDEDTDLLQHRSSVVASKDEKGTLPSDIISRAENVLLAKQFKPRIDRKDTSDSKNSSDVSSPEHSSTKHKETLELKSVVNSEQLKSDTLHVTISNSKDKRSVYSRKDDTKNSKAEIVSKRDRYDRSNRHNHHDDNSTRRAVAVHSARNERERIPDRSDRRERRHTPPREVGRNSSRDHRDYSRKERDRADDAYLREERKHRFDDYYGSSSSRTDSRDRRRPATVTSSSRSRKPYERDSAHHSEREKQESRKRSRSKSHDSGGSHNSYKKKSDRKYNESAEEHRSQKISKVRVHLEEKEPPRRKHSPIKAPDSNTSLPKPVRRNYEDELKFEPDYDDFSEEERSRESKDRQKRKASSPEGSRKVAKMERNVKIDSGVKVLKADKSSVTSSVSSSAASESDSSDSDDQKGSKNKNSDSDYKQKHKKSKHKKHKKHKHKHKKKKSHKSKKD